MRFKEHYELDEGIMNWILPIVLATSVIAKGDDGIVDKIKNVETAKAVKKLVDTAPKEWEKLVKMSSLVKRFSKLDDNLVNVLKSIGQDAESIMKYVQDQKFDIIVDEDMESLINVDVEHKKIYVKDLNVISSLDQLIKNGMINIKDKTDEIKEKIPNKTKEIEPDYKNDPNAI